VVTKTCRLFLQLDHAKCADRLHQIGRHGHQQALVSLNLTWYVRCVHFAVGSA
jgi:hypothetical protein